jgi:hypothetical protein
MKPGDKVRVLRNNVSAHGDGSKQLKPGDIITIYSVHSHEINYSYQPVYGGISYNSIPISDVELVNTRQIKIGDKVRIIRNNDIAHSPHNNFKLLEPGDIITVVEADARYVRYKISSSDTNVIQIKDVELIIEDNEITTKSCSCEITQLMREGCICGAIVKYKE